MKYRNMILISVGFIILLLIPLVVVSINNKTKEVVPDNTSEIAEPIIEKVTEPNNTEVIDEKEDVYFNLTYNIPLYSIVELSTVPQNVQGVVEKMLNEKQEIYFLKKNDIKHSLIILKNVFNDERNTYTRHNLELVEITWDKNNSYDIHKSEIGYAGEADEIVNAPTKFDENNDWQFDKSVEPNRPVKHVKYGENGAVEFTEEWSYSQEEPFKYKLTDGSGKVVSILKETSDDDMNFKQEHIFYDKHGQVSKNITINYDGMNITRITYYDTALHEFNISLVASYENGVCTEEKIYKDNSELINIVKATYTDDRRTSVALFNEKSEKIAELLAENQY